MIIELGRIDIAFEVSYLSIYISFPRTGHLAQALNIFKYMEKHNINYLAFNPCYQRVTSDQDIQSKVQAMKDLYFDYGEEIPSNAPKPRGKPVQVDFLVDSYHEGDRATRKSQTRIILYCNSAPILWYSKIQNRVESSTLGAEFVVLRVATDLILSFKYKLIIIWVPLGFGAFDGISSP